MDKSVNWSLGPAFDMTYSYNPSGVWAASHQMTMNSKRDDFILHDLKACAKAASMKHRRAETIIREVQETVSHWSSYAEEAGAPVDLSDKIQRVMHLRIFKFFSVHSFSKNTQQYFIWIWRSPDVRPRVSWRFRLDCR